MSWRRTNWKWYVFAFLLPFLMMAVLCIRDGVYPFGENCILHIDMYHQYEPFFTEFMDKLKHGGSLMYSFRLGLGSDFVALYAYYLASPLNWLIFLCPESNVIEFMTLLILIKVGLCGLTFSSYLWYHARRLDPVAVVFAAFYALSGYMAAYSWNIMWLDCLVLAPVVVLGLEKLVKEKNIAVYVVSLAGAVLSNFYIAIMLCIFVSIYFLVVVLEDACGIKEKAACFARFFVCSVLAGGMGAVLILPEAAILSYSGSSGVSFPQTFEWYFDAISMLARHSVEVDVYTGRDHWPNLYCGVATLLFLGLYLCNSGISWKKKLKRVAWIVFFWISFMSNVLDFIWHGMHFPDSLPGRQSFLYIFLLLSMAYEAYVHIKETKPVDLMIAAPALTAFLLVALCVAPEEIVSVRSLFLTVILFAAYAVLLLFGMRGQQNRRGLAAGMMIALAVVELYANFSATGTYTTSRTAYTKNWDSVRNLLAEVGEKDEDLFYRVEQMERLTKNDASVYGYSSSTIFSSLMNIGVSRFYKKVGMEGGKNFYSYSGATPLTSAMLSVKYLISGSPLEESPLRTLAAQDGVNYVYQNLYTLPLGFMVDADLEENWEISDSPIKNLNRLAAVIGGADAGNEMLLSANAQVTAGEDQTLIAVYEDCYLYGTYTDTSVTNLTVKNGDRVRKYTKCDHGYILDLGWCKAGDVIEITNSSDVPCFDVRPYQLNMEAFSAAYEKLSRQTMQLDEISDTKIEGHISVKAPGDLLISIPQEAGWSVFVDGKPYESKQFLDSLMKIELTEGTHRIQLNYRTPGLLPGAIISLACFLSFVLICVWKKQRLR